MASDISILLSLTRALSVANTLEQTLQAVVDHCVPLLETGHVSLRLFDPTRTRLLATCRAGKPLHKNSTHPFRIGEGLVGWVGEHGMLLRADDATKDPRFVHRPDLVESLGSFLGVPVMVKTECIGVISSTHPFQAHFTAHHEELLLLVAGVCAPFLEVARLTRLSQVDALTGALNRRGLDLALNADASPETLSVVMVDLDHFKRINDELGHLTGDECLKRMATLLSEVVRAQDALVRYGGEEFLLVLPGIDAAQAAKIAERARHNVAHATFPTGEDNRQLTLSAGVAQKRAAETTQQMLDRADNALYEAKQQGRNRVVVAP